MALIFDCADPAAVRGAAAVESRIGTAAPPLEVAYRSEGVLVAHAAGPRAGDHRHYLADRLGMVLGSLFVRRGEARGTPACPLFGASETERIIHSGGRHLVTAYWGSYFAIILRPGSAACSVLRDPTGTLPCYHVRRGQMHVFFSHLDDFSRCVSWPLTFDWNYLAAHLLTGGGLSRRCAFREIEDVPGGEWITLSGGAEDRRALWTPGQFCDYDSLEDESAAAEALRSTVVNVVRALASEHSDVLMRLSGGLDSSIVASCLSQQPGGPEVTCVNFFIPSGDAVDSTEISTQGLSKETAVRLRRTIDSADEREFARQVAHRCGLKLIEREKSPAQFDCRRMWSAPLSPRPSHYLYGLIEDEAESECASDSRATACFTGHGGDTVFYCTIRAIAALDYAYLHPFGRQLFRHIASTARLSGESIARVIGKTLKCGILRRGNLPVAFEAIDRPHLLTEESSSTVRVDYFRHPWVEDSHPLSPGKQAHLSAVAQSVPAYQYRLHSERIAPPVHPLASQPVVETCLQIPTFVLLANGVSRGLARTAFQDSLPPAVVRRTVKAAAGSFWTQVLRRNLPHIRASLLDGVLVREGLLDRRRLEEYLTPEQSFLTVQAHQVLDYLECEAWLSRWPPV